MFASVYYLNVLMKLGNIEIDKKERRQPKFNYTETFILTWVCVLRFTAVAII